MLKYDRERNRVSLGLKQLGEDPWDNIAPLPGQQPRVRQGQQRHRLRRVRRDRAGRRRPGARLRNGLDQQRTSTRPKVVQVGDEVEVMVLDVDEERRRISLGIKQVTSNPWETFAAMHKKNDKVSGQIKSITDFGIFIGLDGGIDGLIHLSDISWNSTGEDIARNYKKGDTRGGGVGRRSGARAHQPWASSKWNRPAGSVHGSIRRAARSPASKEVDAKGAPSTWRRRGRLRVGPRHQPTTAWTTPARCLKVGQGRGQVGGHRP